MSQELQIALQKYIRETVDTQLKQSLQQINLTEEVAKYVKQSIEGTISKLEFPPASISHGAINWLNFKLNANSITGHFDSINVNELSSPQLDINEDGVQVTSSLSAPDIVSTNVTTTNINAKEVKVENVTVSGQLNAENIVGLNDRIKRFIGGDTLPTSILHSNLRSVGQLHDLVVSGETLLGETLYSSSSGRVGINTDEPSSTFTLWDEETNLNIGKAKKDTIELRSKSNITIGSAVADNIELTKDGDTKISKPVLDGKRFMSVKETPGFSGEKGDIAWNSNPQIGKPVGWVCLGDTVWAKFGIAE